MNTQKLQSSVQMSRQVELLVQDGNHQINRHGNPNLGFHRVGTVSEKVFDTQVTFDPAKEEFNLPSRAVKFGNRYRWNVEMVGQKDQVAASLGIELAHLSQREGKVASRSGIG